MIEKVYYLIKIADPRIKEGVNYLLLGKGGQLFTVTEPIPLDACFSFTACMSLVTKMKGAFKQRYEEVWEECQKIGSHICPYSAE